jgi:hypothetical protein
MRLDMEKSDRFAASKLALLDEDVTLYPHEIEAAWCRTQAKVQKKISPNGIPPFSVPWWRWSLAAAAVTTAFVVVSPPGRAWAETLWNRLLLTRMHNIRIDLAHTAPSLLLPNVFPLYPQNQAVRWTPDSQEAASSLTGFPVRTIAGSALSRFQVVESPVLEHVVDLQTVQADLQRLGRAMPALPAGIDGAHIVLEPQSRSVFSYYGTCPELIGPWKACAMLVQSRPMVLRLPALLNASDFMRFSLELAGLSVQDAGELLAMAGGGPTLFLPLETNAEVRPARVRGAAGMLVIYPRSQSGEVAYALDWQEDGFYFRLFGRDPEQAVSLAESLR